MYYIHYIVHNICVCYFIIVLYKEYYNKMTHTYIMKLKTEVTPDKALLRIFLTTFRQNEPKCC